jgi:nucleoside-diphosphate-sugar epimerase
MVGASLARHDPQIRHHCCATWGVEPVIVDVFDAASLRSALSDCQPAIVIHQLTDLPYALEASKMTEALARNARLRDEGTRNLVEAAVLAGAKRLIAQSISFIYAEGPTPHPRGGSISGRNASGLW